ncbi:MAG: LLM class flavin-dependent oxidoreductase [Archaeoglobus sp.]|nr:LLM class flavin-dependent oxidoreductase [Archaeoglobus sp.]
MPVYGGWFPSRKSAKAEADGVYFEKEDEKPPTYDYVRKVALEAEKIGIDSLWIPDHMLNPIKGENTPFLEAWTLATAIAEATEKVIIAHTTLCEAFRYPAVFGKASNYTN